ncbi:MAG: FISUMP domain-containing protein [bacterium]
MKKCFYFPGCIAILIFIGMQLSAQVGINTDGTDPDPSAILDAKSTSKGLLPPRMTTSQRNGISSPVAGLIVFNTDTKTIDIYTGTSWVQLVPANMNWNCGQRFLDFRDNRSYHTVMIGTQCWFAQNLNIGIKINGTVNQTNNGTIEKYCYNDVEWNCDVYGGLYQWDEMMQYVTTPGTQGICPTGWHLPTDAEWTILTTYLGGVSVAGGKMKETGTTHWASPNTGATNISGFTALPGGYRYNYGDFGHLTLDAYFWSSSQDGAATAWQRGLANTNEGVSRYSWLKVYGFSARCVKD